MLEIIIHVLKTEFSSTPIYMDRLADAAGERRIALKQMLSGGHPVAIQAARRSARAAKEELLAARLLRLQGFAPKLPA